MWSLTDTEFRPRFRRKQKAKQKCKGYKVNIADTADSSLFIGMVWIGTTNNTMPSTVGKCKASFIHQTDSEDPLLNLSFEECDVIVKVTTDTDFLEGLNGFRVVSVCVKLKSFKGSFQVRFLLCCLIRMKVGFLPRFILLGCLSKHLQAKLRIQLKRCLL